MASKHAIVIYMTNPAICERDELDYYTQRVAILLVQDEVLSEANRYGYTQDYIYKTIGRLGCNLAQAGEEDAALHLVGKLMKDVKADEGAVLETWSSLAENGAKIADTKLRQAMGLKRDNDGNTVIDGQIDVKDVRTYFRLLSLYKLGDTSLGPYLHQHIENIEGEDAAQHGVRLAVKLYEAGDESAYNLIKTTAKRAQAHVFNQRMGEKELTADDASDFAQIMKGISGALTPSRSDTERLYAQADISLKYFAQTLLKKGDFRRADEMQSLMLSSFDNAWVNAQRFEMGHDVDGQRLRAVKEYLEVYGEDSGSHILEITNALVRGGDPDAIAEYEEVYDQSIEPEEVDLSIIADMLVALHLSGDASAHNRLIELLKGSDQSWKLIYGLESMGFKNEAIDIAQKEFAKKPNYQTGLTLLNLRYDSDAMKAVQSGAGVYDHELIQIVYSRARHLGKLATHINELEHGRDLQ